MMFRPLAAGVVVASFLVLSPLDVAFADVAPPEGTCEGMFEGNTCTEPYGCESGACARPGSGEEYPCRLECVEGTCVECADADADVSEDPDAGVDAGADATPIFTSVGGCNVGGVRASDVGPWLLALAVPLVIFFRRRFW